MVKEEEIMTEAGGRGYLDMVGFGDEDFFRCLSPSSFSSSVVSTATTGAAPAAASSPTCVSYMDMAPPYHHMLSFTGQEQYDYHHGNSPFGLQYNGGDHAIPVVVPPKSSPTTECSSSISSMSSSPTATSISAISSTKPQAFKKKGSRCADQRKAAAPAAATNKKPRVRRERLGERIMALQQLVSPFGKSDTATVLDEALGYIRFLHDQVQVLSSPYMQRLPASANATVQESAAGTVVEPQSASDLRSRGLCLVPISCTDHVAGDGHRNGADLWSVAVPAGTTVTAAAGSKGAAAMLRFGHPEHLA